MGIESIGSTERSSLHGAYHESQSSDFNKMVNRMKDARSDAYLGIGHMLSTSVSTQLPRKIAPNIFRVAAGAARGLGGVLTLVTSGARIGQTYLKERAEGSTDYRETRKETFVTCASATAGMAAGTVGGVLVSGAVLAGAPLLAVAGVGVLGLAGVGFAAYKGRELAERIFDNYAR